MGGENPSSGGSVGPGLPGRSDPAALRPEITAPRPLRASVGRPPDLSAPRSLGARGGSPGRRVPSSPWPAASASECASHMRSPGRRRVSADSLRGIPKCQKTWALGNFPLHLKPFHKTPIITAWFRDKGRNVASSLVHACPPKSPGDTPGRGGPCPLSPTAQAWAHACPQAHARTSVAPGPIRPSHGAPLWLWGSAGPQPSLGPQSMHAQTTRWLN